MSNFFLSLDADEDLQNIYIFTEEKWGAKQAEKYTLELYGAFELISDNPKIGRLRRELGQGIRSLPHSSHVVFFMEWQGEIAITRVLHNSRDFEELFDTYNPEKSLGRKQGE
ncbi:MAG: type II toxin-antitoxin system RelE/ParE family toxin [Mariprofundaceae bacterium]|nr:type II toxin-antitoxin system RelE/ParE family toxin [Mariprofundaceae bacterium]